MQILSRTIAADKSPRKRFFVHVVEQESLKNATLSHCDHIVICLTAQDMATCSMTTSNVISPEIDADAETTTTSIWDSCPFVKQCLERSIENAKDAILLQRITIVVLLNQDEEDATTRSFLAATASPHTSPIPVFVCRPDQPASCNTVARMLWKRLAMGQRTTTMVSPLTAYKNVVTKTHAT